MITTMLLWKRKKVKDGLNEMNKNTRCGSWHTGQRRKENEKKGCGTRWGGADFGWVVSSHFFFLLDCDPSVNSLAGQKSALGGKKEKKKQKGKIK